MFSELISMMGRAIREPAVHTTAVLASIPAADAGLKALKISTELDPATLAGGLFEPTLWITLGICAVFGGVGGFVAELISLHGHIELPHRVKLRRSPRTSRLANPRYEVDLGVIARLLLGAAAALALLSLYAPTSPTALVVNALIAGSAATGVFRMVQGRLLRSGQLSVASGQKPTSEKDTSSRKPKPQLTVVRGSGSSVAN